MHHRALTEPRLPHKQRHTLSGKHRSVKGGRRVWAREDGGRERQEARGWQWHKQALGSVGGDETESKYSNLLLTINKYVIKPLRLCYYKKIAVVLPRNLKWNIYWQWQSTETGDSLDLLREKWDTFLITHFLNNAYINPNVISVNMLLL